MRLPGRLRRAALKKSKISKTGRGKQEKRIIGEKIGYLKGEKFCQKGMSLNGNNTSLNKNIGNIDEKSE